MRSATDEVAERIVTISETPDGRAATIANGSKLETFPEGFHQVAVTVSSIADRLKSVIDQLRNAIKTLNDLDPVSQDLLIGISAPLEKHLWMMQAQEVS